MTKLTTERLSKLRDNLLQFQDSYSDPADKENYDIFVDALHMLDEFKAAKEQLLAYEQAAKSPAAKIEWDGSEFSVNNVSGEFYYGTTDVYLAPVLPKQPDGTLTNEGTMPAQPVIPRELRSFVTDADIAALHRFAECCDDPESGGHDLEKEQVQRLEKIGALQRSGRISYITDFGDYLISVTADKRYRSEG